MERDFMGLNSKDTVLKKEAIAGCKEASFNNHQEGKFQGAHFLQLHNDARQAVPSSSLGRSLFTPQYFYGAPAVKPHLLGVPVASPPVCPFTGSFYSRKTKPWYTSEVDSSRAQLTISYGGLVNVYDDISPKEAQAIMLMAGNWKFLSAGTTPKPRPAQAHGYTPLMNPAVDEAYLSQPTSTQPSPPVSSPMSVSSHPVGQASCRPTNKTEETERLLSSLGQVIQSVFPQAHKASLARFLEKRKERRLASAPYSLSKASTTQPKAMMLS